LVETVISTTPLSALLNTLAADATEVAAVGVPPETVTSRTTVLEPSCVTAAYEAMPTATAARKGSTDGKDSCHFVLSSTGIPTQETSAT
jgi:hypothetical protein